MKTLLTIILFSMAITSYASPCKDATLKSKVGHTSPYKKSQIKLKNLSQNDLGMYKDLEAELNIDVVAMKAMKKSSSRYSALGIVESEGACYIAQGELEDNEVRRFDFTYILTSETDSEYLFSAYIYGEIQEMIFISIAK